MVLAIPGILLSETSLLFLSEAVRHNRTAQRIEVSADGDSPATAVLTAALDSRAHVRILQSPSEAAASSAPSRPLPRPDSDVDPLSFAGQTLAFVRHNLMNVDAPPSKVHFTGVPCWFEQRAGSAMQEAHEREVLTAWTTEADFKGATKALVWFDPRLYV